MPESISVLQPYYSSSLAFSKTCFLSPFFLSSPFPKWHVITKKSKECRNNGCKEHMVITHHPFFPLLPKHFPSTSPWNLPLTILLYKCSIYVSQGCNKSSNIHYRRWKVWCKRISALKSRLKLKCPRPSKKKK